MLGYLETLRLYFIEGKAFECNEESVQETESDSQDYDVSFEVCPTLRFSSANGESYPPSHLSLDPSVLANRFTQLARRDEHASNIITGAGRRLLVPFLRDSFAIDDAWLNDVLINRWFDYLCAQDLSSKSTHVNSTFNENYLRSIQNNGECKEDRKRLLNATTIYLPRHIGNHWYLVIVTKYGDHIDFSCMDSLSSIPMNDMHQTCIDYAQTLMRSLYGRAYDNFIISTSSKHMPRQSNAFDCGVAICYQGLRHSQNAPSLRDETLDYSPFRLEMARELLNFFNNNPRDFDNGTVRQGRRTRTYPGRSLGARYC
ncbi:MAG: Ulp1 family isopeptidase [Candidatus Berkiella sp.]